MMTVDELLASAETASGRGDAEGAIASWRQAVAASPRLTLGHYRLGLALHHVGRTGEGIAHYQAVLATDPTYVEAWINLGDLHGKNADADQALAAWRKALELDTESQLAARNIAITLRNLGREGDALSAYRHLAALSPGKAEHWIEAGNLAARLKRHGEAEESYRLATLLDAQSLPAQIGWARALRALKHDEKALPVFQRILDEAPQLIDVRNDMGLCLMSLGRRDEAIALFRSLVAADGSHRISLANLANALQGTGVAADVREAIGLYDRLLAMESDNAGWQWNRSVAHWTLGEYDAAWRGYEARYDPRRGELRSTRPPEIGVPMWRGESLDGKRLLILQEQGFGDQIQCLRFIPRLAEAGAVVTVCVAPPLAPLVREMGSVANVITTYPANQRLDGEYDVWAFFMSLPGCLGLTEHDLPGPIPYLKVPGGGDATFAGRITHHAAGRPRVGLNWAGFSGHYNDRFRSLRFAELAPLLGREDVAFISLQHGRQDEAEAARTSGRLLMLGDEVRNFGDSAAILAELDWLVTVDSALAHLAGAMDCPTALLLPRNADFRWLLDRDDSPWYPSLRIYRQRRLGEWMPLLEQLAATPVTRERQVPRNK